MKATELRIGNLVNENGEVIKIRQETLCDFANGYVVFEPIPLTEEWLLKFGFKQCENEFWFEKGILLINTIGTINIKGRKGSEATFNSDVKFVHLLQNLYFALTGEELELT